jgi:hypothetical protein
VFLFRESFCGKNKKKIWKGESIDFAAGLQEKLNDK